MFHERAIIRTAVALPLLLATGAIADVPTFTQRSDAVQAFRAEHPTARMMGNIGQAQRVVAPNMATGETPAAAATSWIGQYAGMLGVDVANIVPNSPFPSGENQLGLMYQRDTGTYKFTNVYFTQTAMGLPVWNSRLSVLCRNMPGFPVVQAAADLRDMRNFQVPAVVPVVNEALATKVAAEAMGADAYLADTPQLVIYAGQGERDYTPVVAMVFEAKVSDNTDPDNYQKERYVMNATTGEVLLRENRVLNVDGHVHGLATTGSGADECEPEAEFGLPYARVTQNGQTYYADANGDFSTNGGGTIVSYLDGLYFNVNNSSGSDAQLSSSNGIFLHNSSNNDPELRAQVNAYLESNIVRDFALSFHPNFPVIADEMGFPANTGVSGSCNAYYDYESINFYNASGGCNNTAFSVIVHHEYGHHMVACAGSGQGQYGEGAGDVMGVLITGDNHLARGFFQGSCSEGIRNADNNKQFPCSGGIHDCGQLLSGCVWDTMQLLPVDVVANLWVNSMPMHTGENIDPTITMDWLVLDDDNGDIDDGTPNSAEILQAFALHNMDQIPEPLDNDDCETARAITWGEWDVNTMGAGSSGVYVDESQCSGTYMTECDPDVWYSLTACGTGNMTVSLCDTITFDSDLAVYTGSCGDLQQIACNGDGPGCGGYTSYLEVGVTEGQQIFIRVGGWNGATGTGYMTVSGPGDPCLDEACLGDLNDDGTVSVDDLLEAISGFGDEYSVEDILEVLAYFGTDC